MSAAVLDEALDQWSAATIVEVDAVDADHLTIEEDHAREVQFALVNLPVSSKLCATKATTEETVEVDDEAWRF